MVIRANGAFGTEVAVSDRIVLTIPTNARFRGVATLVVGGIGGRADLPYERMDDLQLAVLSVLDSTDGDVVTLDVSTDDRRLVLAIGPVSNGSGEDEGLGLVLSRLVDEFAYENRDGAEWLILGLSSTRPAK
jgi:anti-sigma regulatory factor (Ser/Thr protein kinase)